MRWARPRKLEKGDDLADFRSGRPLLDDWLIRFAWGSQQSGMARVFVANEIDQPRVAGFYALAVGGVAQADAPLRLTKGSGRNAIPVVLLARFAVAADFRGHGLGKALLSDALKRVLNASAEVGIRALIIHAKDDAARAFYMKQAEFEQSPTDPLHLFLSMKDLQKVNPSQQ